MSRVDKKLRRKHRKEKKQSHSRIMRDWIAPLDAALPANVKLVSYDITFEPLELADQKTAGLEEALGDTREQLFEDVHENPKAAIPVLERLLEQFPSEPMLLNWLSAALTRAGDFDASTRIARQNFEANPHYLFARLNYAQVRLQEGDLAAVEEILERKFDLKLLYPERDVFHVSEYRALCGLMIPYWIRKGEFKAARLLFETLEQFEPDGEVTQKLRSAVEGSVLLEAVRKLADFSLRKGRLPRL
jgi:tetratricopeptide (TPR) repeat protein